MNSAARVILIGGGGHARVILEVLTITGCDVLGFVDRDPSAVLAGNVDRLGAEDAVMGYASRDVSLANGIGSVGKPGSRCNWFEVFRKEGYRFSSVIHPAATVSGSVSLGEGVQVMAGAMIQVAAILEDNVLVNTGAVVDHGCRIGSHVHIAPGAVLCGDVSIGERTHVGAGATIIQGVRVGEDCVIGAGSVVVSDVASGETVMGVPARSR